MAPIGFKEIARAVRFDREGILYWNHVPHMFRWPADADHECCPFGSTYQLVRNVLAVALSPRVALIPW